MRSYLLKQQYLIRRVRTMYHEAQDKSLSWLIASFTKDSESLSLEMVLVFKYESNCLRKEAETIGKMPSVGGLPKGSYPAFTWVSEKTTRSTSINGNWPRHPVYQFWAQNCSATVGLFRYGLDKMVGYFENIFSIWRCSGHCFFSLKSFVNVLRGN